MPKARIKVVEEVKVEEVKKWLMSFQERQAFLTCPVCNNTINYNIVAMPTECPRCHTKLGGYKFNG